MVTGSGVVWASDRRPWLRWVWLGAFGLGCVQGVLGGLRVTGTLNLADDPSLLDPRIELAIVHGVNGQVFFALLVGVSAALSPTWRGSGPPTPAGELHRQHHRRAGAESLDEGCQQAAEHRRHVDQHPASARQPDLPGVLVRHPELEQDAGPVHGLEERPGLGHHGPLDAPPGDRPDHGAVVPDQEMAPGRAGRGTPRLDHRGQRDPPSLPEPGKPLLEERRRRPRRGQLAA